MFFTIDIEGRRETNQTDHTGIWRFIYIFVIFVSIGCVLENSEGIVLAYINKIKSKRVDLSLSSSSYNSLEIRVNHL